ncbi:MAG TPA: plasma-membrane proton-efflux P-type ATPase [Methanosarcinaceae archaeon]|nr:plasma-membrane proton-efflux P-type ATPase [Methanosarcinaceae archaeon]
MQGNFIGIDEAENQSIEELLENLSSSRTGLSPSEAAARLQQFGANEIQETKVNPLIKFLNYFWGPIPWMIEVAAVLSAFIHHWEDFGIIITLLLVNAVVGFWQENKADNAIELLKKRLALKARVLRDGKWSEISSKELVPGDVVRVRLGDIVPADIKLIDGDYMLSDESTLTGESLPVEKHVSDIAYTGSIVKQGEMDALVVATGVNTYFGKTASLVAGTKTQSHFQKAIIKIGNYLIILALVLVAVIFIVSMFRHDSIFDTLQFILVLIVAAIPVALPAVLTVTMAVGATTLAKKEAIVSKLVAIEEMAGMDILCSDKTGTITKNELTIGEVKAFPGFSDNDVLLNSALASREEDRDPIDDAIFDTIKTYTEINKALGALKVVKFKPFDPVSKQTEATVEGDGDRFKVAKGAPQAVLSMIINKEPIALKINEYVDSFAAKGYRALGVARTDSEGDWQFVGLLGLYDPPREDSADTIKTAQSMGVDVKMVTGDHIAIAREIAQQVNLSTNLVLFDDKPENEGIVEEAGGFVQVFPEHKYRIIELLQNRGHIVGMTGDGVNDAPALKRADVGIAVAGATDAAKSAADIVFTSPGLSVIIDAIIESRKIFQRMNNYAIYRIAETIRILIFLTLAILIFNFFPVTAMMIVLLAMLNDIPIMMIAYDNTRRIEKSVRWDMRKVLTIAAVLGVAGVFSTFLLFWMGEVVLHFDRMTIQTIIFLKLAVAGHMTIYLARTGGDHFWVRPFPAAPLILAAESTQIIATLFAVYGIFMEPIGWGMGLFIWVYALLFFVLNDFIKVRFYRLAEHSGRI